MHSSAHVQNKPRAAVHHITRGYQLLVMFAVLCCFVGTATAQAQPPIPPEEDPAFIDFTATQFPGEDNWLISGQLVGCEDPSDIEVTISGVVNATATTDEFGFFEVVVTYAGAVDMAIADADYGLFTIPTAYCSIGF